MTIKIESAIEDLKADWMTGKYNHPYDYQDYHLPKVDAPYYNEEGMVVLTVFDDKKSIKWNQKEYYQYWDRRSKLLEQYNAKSKEIAKTLYKDIIIAITIDYPSISEEFATIFLNEIELPKIGKASTFEFTSLLDKINQKSKTLSELITNSDFKRI